MRRLFITWFLMGAGTGLLILLLLILLGGWFPIFQIGGSPTSESTEQASVSTTPGAHDTAQPEPAAQDSLAPSPGQQSQPGTPMPPEAGATTGGDTGPPSMDAPQSGPAASSTDPGVSPGGRDDGDAPGAVSDLPAGPEGAATQEPTGAASAGMDGIPAAQTPDTPQGSEQAPVGGAPDPTETEVMPLAEPPAASPAGGPQPQATPVNDYYLAVVRGAGARLRPEPVAAENDGQPVPSGSVLYATHQSEGGAWIYAQAANADQSGWIERSQLSMAPNANLPAGAPPAGSASQPDASGAAAASEATAPAPRPENEAAEQAPAIAATVNTDRSRLNVRNGPGTAYLIIAQAQDGVRLPVKARNETGDWLLLDISAAAQAPGAQGWVSADFVSVDGDVSALPISNWVDRSGSSYGILDDS